MAEGVSKASVLFGLPGNPARGSWLAAVPSIRALLIASDIAAIGMSSLAAGIGYHLAVHGSIGKVGHHIALAVAQSAILLPLLGHHQAYGAKAFAPVRYQAPTIAGYWSATILLLLGIGFGLKVSEDFSRGAVLGFAFFGLVLLLFQRVMVQHWGTRAIARGDLPGRRAVLVVAGDPTSDTRLLAASGYNLTATINFQPGTDLGQVAHRILAATRGSDAREILLAIPWREWDMLRQLLVALRATPLPVRLLPDATSSEILRHPWTETGFGPSFELQRAPLSTGEQLIKRAFDIVVAGILLLLLAPVLLLLAIAVKLDSAGPALFQQTRNGFNGRPFRIFKFRSMRVMEDGPLVVQARRHDARVTRVGAWLRRLSLDELPQLLNVLRGDMSLIGPRPHAIAHDDEYTRLISNYANRHHMKPGITGWAQVNGCRGETPTVEAMEARVQYDLWYIANWSIALDIKIMVQTFGCLFRTQNVY